MPKSYSMVLRSTELGFVPGILRLEITYYYCCGFYFTFAQLTHALLSSFHSFAIFSVAIRTFASTPHTSTLNQ